MALLVFDISSGVYSRIPFNSLGKSSSSSDNIMTSGDWLDLLPLLRSMGAISSFELLVGLPEVPLEAGFTGSLAGFLDKFSTGESCKMKQ